ncbi:MAG: hypothetical protein R2854_17320 [Caldilineaceae bacterium]
MAYLLLRTMSWVGRTRPLLWLRWRGPSGPCGNSSSSGPRRKPISGADLLLIIPVVIGLSIAAVVLLFIKRGTDKI